MMAATATGKRARSRTVLDCGLNDAAAPDGLFMGDGSLVVRGQRRLDGLRTKPPYHRSGLIYRLPLTGA